MYDQLYTRLPDNKSFLRIFLGREPIEAYTLIAQDIITGGMTSIIAESHIALALVSEILGIKPDVTMLGLYQVKFKKMVIAAQETLEDDNDFIGVGPDGHVKQTFSFFCQKDSDFILNACRTMDPQVGWWANELVGQMKQLLEKNSGNGRAVAMEVLLRLAIEFPFQYDGLLNELVGEIDWSQKEREKRSD